MENTGYKKKINIRDILRLSKMREIQQLTILLGNRALNKLGAINNIDEINYHPQLQNADELSFTVYKELNGEPCLLWDKIVDFKLIYVKEYDEWFEITVSIDESENTTKKEIVATSLCAAELSQLLCDQIQINNENDPYWMAVDRKIEEGYTNVDYPVTVFYDKDNLSKSLLHRVLGLSNPDVKGKASNYNILHVDDTLKNLWSNFSISEDTSMYDALTKNIADEFGCLFLFDDSDKATRNIYVYDLETTCNVCGYRSDITFNVCPDCQNDNEDEIIQPYGDDTMIFVDKNNLAESLQLETDTDSVKNVFRISAGDENMTAAAILQNFGSPYLYYFSEDMKEDLPKNIVDKLDNYEKLQKEYADKPVDVSDFIQEYNTIRNECLALLPEGEQTKDFEEAYPLFNNELTNYNELLNSYWTMVDFLGYLQTSMSPMVYLEDKDLKRELTNLETALGNTIIQVTVKNLSTMAKSTAESALKLFCNSVVNTAQFKVDIETISYSSPTWRGNIKLEDWSDEENRGLLENITVNFGNTNFEEYIKQQAQYQISKMPNNNVKNIYALDDPALTNQAKRYSLDSLNIFIEALSSIPAVLEKITIKDFPVDDVGKTDKYEAFISKYSVRQKAIINVRDERAVQLNTIDKKVLSGIKAKIDEINAIVNFENYMGSDYNTILSYRREDSYKNDNYISEGLTNSQIFEKAAQYIITAKDELIKSNERKYSISGSLANFLLIVDENGERPFEKILDDFTLGNYIRTKIDGKIYKMRFSDADINYDDLSSLNLTFYDITKVGHTIIDKAKDLLDNVSSMSGSYSTVQRTAERGYVAEQTLEKLRREGLDSAQYNVFSNNAEVIFDQYGLLARNLGDDESFEDDSIRDGYSAKQMRLNGTDIIFTRDNWETTSAALGLQRYTLDGVLYEEYAVNADTVISGKIISGDIYSGNWTTDKNGKIATGAHIDLTNGIMELGTNFKYDSKQNTLDISNGGFVGGHIYSDNWQSGVQGTHINLENGYFEFGGDKLVLNDTGLSVKGKVSAISGDIGSWKINTDGISKISNSKSKVVEGQEITIITEQIASSGGVIAYHYLGTIKDYIVENVYPSTELSGGQIRFGYSSNGTNIDNYLITIKDGGIYNKDGTRRLLYTNNQDAVVMNKCIITGNGNNNNDGLWCNYVSSVKIECPNIIGDLTGNATRSDYSGHADVADSATYATKATQDGNGNNIVNTYGKKNIAETIDTTNYRFIKATIQDVGKVMYGYFKEKSYAMTNAYGNAYWASFKLTLPSFFAGISNAVLQAYGGTGLCSIQITNWSKDAIEGFIFSPASETKNITISAIIYGN